MQNWKAAGFSGINASRLEQIWERKKLRNRYLYILYVFFVDVFFFFVSNYIYTNHF